MPFRLTPVMLLAAACLAPARSAPDGSDGPAFPAAAEAASAALEERVRSLPLSDEQTVNDWARQATERDLALIRRCWGAPVGARVHFSTGAVAARAVLERDALGEWLRAARGDAQRFVFESGPARLAAVGYALPSATADGAGPGWRGVSPEDRSLTLEAGRAGALAALWARCAALPVAPGTRFGDLLRSDETRAVVRSELAGIVTIEPTWLPERVLRIEAWMETVELIRLAARVAAAAGDDAAVAASREALLTTTSGRLTTTHWLAPPTAPADEQAFRGASGGRLRERWRWAEAVAATIAARLALRRALSGVAEADLAKLEAVAAREVRQDPAGTEVMLRLPAGLLAHLGGG